jgi:FdhE protein
MTNPHRTGIADAAWSEDARQAIREQAESTPESQPWLALLEMALEAADQESWRGTHVQLAARKPADAPVLEGARITVAGPATDALVSSLLETIEVSAAGGRGPDPGPRLPGCSPLDPLQLIGAGIRQDRPALDRLAASAGLDGGVLATVAHFAALPLLLAAGRQSVDRVPSEWRAGYCPICAGWPTLVELRGLERRRVLRCGRCAAGWERDVLHCPFCGERDHRRQGALVPRDRGELLRVETCASCHGYVKSVTTLRPRPLWALPLEDLRTLELELGALERGFRRPDRPAWPLDVVLTAGHPTHAVPAREQVR